MQPYLYPEVISPPISVYQLHGLDKRELRGYVVSTPETRAICNCPEILGCQYTDMLRTAMVKALQTIPFVQQLVENFGQEICVVNILRGGLNFDLRNALHLAYNLNGHATSYISSQRYKQNDHFVIKEDTYRKLTFPPDAVVFISDVVATGATVENCLNIMADHLGERKIGLRNLVFFTIGCPMVEAVLSRYDAVLRRISPNYNATYLVYLEGRFRLVAADTELRICIPGTDFVRFDSLLAPEFELSQYRQIHYPLERCTIYDAGSRAFDAREYLEDVRHYWELVKELSSHGMTLREAMKERWPEREYRDYPSFCESKQEIWHGIDRSILDQLYLSYQDRWSDSFLAHSRSADALYELCETRLAQLSGMPGPSPICPGNEGLGVL